jgi:hypothetical protein
MKSAKFSELHRSLFVLCCVVAITQMWTVGAIAKETPLVSILRCEATADKQSSLPSAEDILFFYSDDKLTATRRTEGSPEKEDYVGAIRSDGSVAIAGEGSYDGREQWRSSFQGRIEGTGDTTLAGEMRSSETGAQRQCSIKFSDAISQYSSKTASSAGSIRGPLNGNTPSHAALLIGEMGDPKKPTVNTGSALWSTIAAVGDPSTFGVRVEVDIPDQKLHATVTIWKNIDASLPATHTIDLRATFADGAEIKGVEDMGLPQLRRDDAPTGEAVSGVRVKINDSYYLVGLTRSDTDAAHNLDLLATRDWFDFPLLLDNGRIAPIRGRRGRSPAASAASAGRSRKRSRTAKN